MNTFDISSFANADLTCDISHSENIYQPLQANPRVEVCFYTPEDGRCLCVTGAVESRGEAWIRTLNGRPSEAGVPLITFGAGG